MVPTIGGHAEHPTCPRPPSQPARPTRIGRARPAPVRCLGGLPRRPGPLPPLQPPQRDAHHNATTRGHPRSRVRHLASARTAGAQGRASHQHLGPDGHRGCRWRTTRPGLPMGERLRSRPDRGRRAPGSGAYPRGRRPGSTPSGARAGGSGPSTQDRRGRPRPRGQRRAAMGDVHHRARPSELRPPEGQDRGSRARSFPASPS